MQPLERGEQLARIGGVEAGAIIAHVKADRAVLGRHRPELDRRLVTLVGELPRVLQQVLQDSADELAVRLRPGRLLPGEGDPAFWLAALELLDDPGGFRAKIDRLEAHLGPGNPRQVKQVVDELRHLIAGAPDAPGVAVTGLAEGVGVVLKQCGAETANRSQRSAQVVGDRVREALQVLVGPFEIGCPAAKLGLGLQLRGNVPGDRRRPHQRAALVVHGRDRHRHGEAAAVLALPLGPVVHDALPAGDPGEELIDLADPVGRAQGGDRLADDLSGRVPVHPLGGRVPARDRAVHGLPHDGVVGGVHDRRQQGGRIRVAATARAVSRLLAHWATPPWMELAARRALQPSAPVTPSSWSPTCGPCSPISNW